MADSTLNRFSKIATDPLRNFRFLVTFTAPEGDTSNVSFSGGFSSVSGLGVNIQNITYREGGMNTTLHQMPGQASFNTVNLQRGTIYKKAEAMDWMKQLFAAASGEGIKSANSFRCNLEIYVLDHPTAGATDADAVGSASYKMKFVVHNAWISGLNYNDLQAQGNEVLYENISLVHEGISWSFV